LLICQTQTVVGGQTVVEGDFDHQNDSRREQDDHVRFPGP
jgi:hypothetical protein